MGKRRGKKTGEGVGNSLANHGVNQWSSVVGLGEKMVCFSMGSMDIFDLVLTDQVPKASRPSSAVTPIVSLAGSLIREEGHKNGPGRLICFLDPDLSLRTENGLQTGNPSLAPA